MEKLHHVHVLIKLLELSNLPNETIQICKSLINIVIDLIQYKIFFLTSVSKDKTIRKRKN